jgi:ubiquinol-cytochrome c reductase cytochrome c subunit
MFVRIGAVVFGMVASGLSGAVLAQSAPDGDAARGQSLYESTGCYECHGFIGQGGAPGPAIAPPMPFEPFVLQLRQPRLVMIPYSEIVLSDQDAADIYAYLSSLPPPADPASIPLLQTMP